MNRKDEHVSLAKAFHDKQKNEFDFVNGHVLYVDGGILAYIGKQP